MRYALLHVQHGSDWKHRPFIDAKVLAMGDDKAALEEQAEQQAHKDLEEAAIEYPEQTVVFLSKADWKTPHLNFTDDEEPSFSSYLVVELPDDQ